MLLETRKKLEEKKDEIKKELQGLSPEGNNYIIKQN